jgi:peroxiredoxin (alkyl hydroperoxide reductase subunit C)
MLKPGDVAPPFDLPCAIGDRIDRLALRQITTEMLVLFFYPRDFSFICPTEVVGFHRRTAEFRAENTSLVGVSVDSAESHVRWIRELGGIDYPLLADERGDLARAYDVLDEAKHVAIRATFVIDRKREIAFAVACPLNIGRSVSETLRIVQAIRTGRLCPAEWQPGAAFGPIESDL